MQGLTYLKRLEQKKSKSWWPLIVILLIMYSLALGLWTYGMGLLEGMVRMDAAVTKAAQIGYDAGVEKGLEALRCKNKKGGC